MNANPNNKWGRKLTAIHALGRTLVNMTARQIANRFFGGILRTSELNEANVLVLDKLPFIGPPSARYMMRNMGSEQIKDDRWLLAFMNYFQCSGSDLESAGTELGWRAGRVDQIIWGFCVQELRKTGNLETHFRSIGFLPEV